MDGQELENKALALVKSRKFWAAIVGLVFVFAGNRAGLEQQQLVEGIGVIMAYILGTGLEDLRAK